MVKQLQSKKEHFRRRILSNVIRLFNYFNIASLKLPQNDEYSVRFAAEMDFAAWGGTRHRLT
jgi:hypothetical protein